MKISTAIIMTFTDFQFDANFDWMSYPISIRLKTLLRGPFIRTVSYKSLLASSVTI